MVAGGVGKSVPLNNKVTERYEMYQYLGTMCLLNNILYTSQENFCASKKGLFGDVCRI